MDVQEKDCALIIQVRSNEQQSTLGCRYGIKLAAGDKSQGLLEELAAYGALPRKYRTSCKPEGIGLLSLQPCFKGGLRLGNHNVRLTSQDFRAVALNNPFGFQSQVRSQHVLMQTTSILAAWHGAATPANT